MRNNIAILIMLAALMTACGTFKKATSNTDTTTTNKILSDEKIEAIQATLPQGMTLSRKTEPNHEYIVLSVRPKWGTIVIVN